MCVCVLVCCSSSSSLSLVERVMQWRVCIDHLACVSLKKKKKKKKGKDGDLSLKAWQWEGGDVVAREAQPSPTIGGEPSKASVVILW